MSKLLTPDELDEIERQLDCLHPASHENERLLVVTLRDAWRSEEEHRQLALYFKEKDAEDAVAEREACADTVQELKHRDQGRAILAGEDCNTDLEFMYRDRAKALAEAENAIRNRGNK